MRTTLSNFRNVFDITSVSRFGGHCSRLTSANVWINANPANSAPQQPLATTSPNIPSFLNGKLSHSRVARTIAEITICLRQLTALRRRCFAVEERATRSYFLSDLRRFFDRMSSPKRRSPPALPRRVDEFWARRSRARRSTCDSRFSRRGSSSSGIDRYFDIAFPPFWRPSGVCSTRSATRRMERAPTTLSTLPKQ